MVADRLFLAILEGENAREARLILATEDQGFIKEVGRAISRRLGERDGSAQVLKLDRRSFQPHGGRDDHAP